MDPHNSIPSLSDSWRDPKPPHALDPWERPQPNLFQHPLVTAHGPQSVLGQGSIKGKGKELEKHDEDDISSGMGMDGLWGPKGVEVLANVMDTSRGRDKVLKCAQYSLRTYLYVLTIISRTRLLPPWFKSNRKRIAIAVSGLSLTRKCLLLLNPLHPLSALLSPSPTSATTLLKHLIALASALSDDIYCFSRLGLINRRTGKNADKWANRLWLLTTLMGLWKIHVEVLPRMREKIARVELVGVDAEDRMEVRRQMWDVRWSNRKFLADLIFVSYDVFHLTWFEEPIKCLTGLLAALISTNKLYDQQWRASLGKG